MLGSVVVFLCIGKGSIFCFPFLLSPKPAHTFTSTWRCMPWLQVGHSHAFTLTCEQDLRREQADDVAQPRRALLCHHRISNAVPRAVRIIPVVGTCHRGTSNRCSPSTGGISLTIASIKQAIPLMHMASGMAVAWRTIKTVCMPPDFHCCHAVASGWICGETLI